MINPQDLSMLLQIQRDLNDISMRLHGIHMTSGELSIELEHELSESCSHLRECKGFLEKGLERFRAK